MRTPAQIEASRRNGAKSRGPVTPEGKARSSANATTHGIHSRIVVLNNEPAEDFEHLLQQLLDEHQPVTDHQVALVEDLAACTWRLSRVLALETAAIDFEVDRQRQELDRTFERIDEGTRTALAVAALTTDGRALAWYGRQESRLRRAIRDARKELAASMAAPPSSPAGLNDSTPVPEPSNAEMSKGTQAQPAAEPCLVPSTIAQSPLQDQQRQPVPEMPEHARNSRAPGLKTVISFPPTR